MALCYVLCSRDGDMIPQASMDSYLRQTVPRLLSMVSRGSGKVQMTDDRLGP